MELEALRAEIDEIDGEIISLIQQRMDVSAKIGAYKRKTGMAVLDSGREAAKLERIGALCRDEYRDYVKALYGKIFELSRDYQTALLERDNG